MWRGKSMKNTQLCKKFIGKRILVGSALRLYQRQKYKTNEERAQKHSLAVAWIAVVISVISVFAGSILPLFQPKRMDYFQTISGQLETISDRINQINSTPES